MYIRRTDSGRPRWQVVDRDTELVLRTLDTFAEANDWMAQASRRR